MKTKSSLYSPFASSTRRFLILCLLGLGLTLPAIAGNVFQANLSTSGGTSQLSFGRFYLRVEGNEVDFMTVIFPFGALTENLSPLLTVPGDSLTFSLGEATRSWLHGTHTVADQNPFLPTPPWLPHAYDENGNPLYLDAAVIRLADIYTGHFTLPAGFADDLLAGLGHINLGATFGGSIAVVPEPTSGALLLLTGIGWCCGRRWHATSPSLTTETPRRRNSSALDAVAL